MNEIILVIHDIRSIHNVGSMLRTAECFGVQKVYITGYSPYPRVQNDDRLPHIITKTTDAITKTALGAEKLLDIQHHENIDELLTYLKSQDYSVVAAEQHPTSISLPSFRRSGKIALIMGREVEGVDPTILAACDTIIEIPMRGQKESFNVSVAAGIVLYQLSL